MAHAARTETVNGQTFTWHTEEYVSRTGSDHTREGFRIDGKRVAANAFYKALSDARKQTTSAAAD